MPTPLGRWPASSRPLGIGFMIPCSDRSAFGGTPRFTDMREMIQMAADADYPALWASGTLLGTWRLRRLNVE